MTDEQKQAQHLLATQSDLEWLSCSYLAARYPNASSASVPVDGYTFSEAQRAVAVAGQVLSWAGRIKDLPGPSQREVEEPPTPPQPVRR